jgi:hypothetical protein
MPPAGSAQKGTPGAAGAEQQWLRLCPVGVAVADARGHHGRRALHAAEGARAGAGRVAAVEDREAAVGPEPVVEGEAAAATWDGEQSSGPSQASVAPPVQLPLVAMQVPLALLAETVRQHDCPLRQLIVPQATPSSDMSAGIARSGRRHVRVALARIVATAGDAHQEHP